MSDDDTDWLNVEVDASDSNGQALALILRDVADTLDKAPQDARYDLSLEVTER